MIESGFYYTGCGDRVTCFHCGITLRNWEHADNVDMEHKKHKLSKMASMKHTMGLSTNAILSIDSK